MTFSSTSTPNIRSRVPNYFRSLLLSLFLLHALHFPHTKAENSERKIHFSGPSGNSPLDRTSRAFTHGPYKDPLKNGRILTGPVRQKTRVRTINLKTSLGLAVGTIDSSTSHSHNSNEDTRVFYSFRGIPYAKAPVGPLRWADPEDETDPWQSGKLDATRFRSPCPQWNWDKKIVIGNEDCLYLNIFTPFIPGPSLGTGLPVLVFIHGGAYSKGSSSHYGPERLMRENIVLVTINYRLGALGFLSTGDPSLAGNYGALDQVSALRWIRQHINEFGGNPNSVTLGGFSAGASFAHLHMLSPLAAGLFHKVIMMSGAGNCIWSVQNEPWEVAEELASDLGCSTSSSESLKDCLRMKDSKTLIKAQTKQEHFWIWPLSYRPVFDDQNRDSPFLPASVKDLEVQPLASPVPVLMGGTPDEGILFALKILLDEEGSSIASVFNSSANYIFESLWPNKTTAKEVSNALSAYYFSQKAREDIDTFIAEMTEATTDLFFTSCIWRAAQDFAEKGLPVYTYLMTHHDPESPSYSARLYNQAFQMGASSPLLSHGVSHGDDVMLLFSSQNGGRAMQKKDHVMSQMMTRFWANFVRKGSPQIEELLSQGTPSWRPLVAGDPLCFYRLSLSPMVIEQPFRHKEQKLWTKALPVLEKLSEEASEGYTWQVATWLLLTLVILLILLLLCVAILIYRKGRTKEYSKGLPTLKTQISRLSSFRRDSR